MTVTGSGGAGRRRGAVRHPAARVRRADRRLRRRRARRSSRPSTTSCATAGVAGSIGRLSLGVFDTATARAAARRLARRRAPARQHPSRPPRGLRQRPGLPAPRGLRAFGCVLGAAPGRRSRPGQAHRAGGVRGGPRPRLVRRGPGADAVAGPAQRRVRRAMAGIYYRLLGRIAATPAAVLTRRVSLSAGEKAAVAVKSLATAAVRPPRRRPRPPAATPGAAR